MHNARVFYERILPTLNGVRPVQANASTKSAWVRSLGQGNATTGAIVSSAVREAAVLLGEDSSTADGYLALSQLELLIMARRDLDRAKSLAVRDAVVLDGACRSIARNCVACATDTT